MFLIVQSYLLSILRFHASSFSRKLSLLITYILFFYSLIKYKHEEKDFSQTNSSVNFIEYRTK